MATPEEIRANVLETSTLVENTLKSVASQIGDIFQDALSEADGITKVFGKDVQKQLNSLARSTDKMIENQLKINAGQTSSKDISKQLLNYETKREVLQKRINNLMGEQPQLAQELQNQLNDVNNANADYIDGLKEQEIELKRIEDKMGVLGKLAKGLSKIPILGNLINAGEVEEKMKAAAAAGRSPLVAGFKEIGKSVKEGLTDPLTLSIFFLNQALKANKQIVELGKQLGKDSYTYRQNLASAARFNSNINITTENLVGAFNELVTASGLAYEYSVDQLAVQVKLTKQVGLQADEAAQIQKFGVLNNQTSEKTYSSFVKGLVSARNQLRVGIDFKATLAEAVKVSGQLAANLGYNPERIAKAVVTAKAFGMTLEQVAKSGESLLNFESSIESELKAELLTGKQLNLERARAAALQGDQIALAEELAKNVGTAADFTKMNVLQQKALAESVGMTADELSNTLVKREQALASGKSLAQITEEEAKTALERQAIQDKFNQAILKLQDFFGNLIAGPFGTFLDMLSSSLGLITSIGAGLATWYATSKLIAGSQALITFYSRQKVLADTAGISVGRQIITQLGTMLGISSARAVAETAASAAMTFGTSIPIILGAAASIYGLIQSFKADDLMSEGGYGKRTLLAPEGAFKLNDNDTIIAGTDLSGGGGSMPSIDLTPMIAAINEVRASVDRLYNKNTTINMDSKQVGSTLVQSSYKLA